MKSFARGVKWSSTQQIINISVNYASLIFLTNFLSAEDFGLVALATVLTGLFQVLNGFGIPQLIIKDHIKDRSQVGFFFTLSGILSIGLTFLCILLGQIYVWWFKGNNHEELTTIITVSSSSLIFSSISAIYNAQYQRDLDFKRPAIFTSITLVIGQALSIAYAAIRADYWALVIRNVAPTILLVLVFIFFSSYNPTFNLKKKFLIEDRRFTFWLSTNQIFNYVSRNLDYVIIGRFFDVGIVGQYSIAYRIMLFPMKFMSSRVQAVLYPTLARMKKNNEEVIKFYVNVVSYIGSVSLPLMAFAGLTSFLWIPLIFDVTRYDYLVQLVQFLTIAGAFQAISSPIGSLYLVFNKTRLMTFYSIISSMIFLGGYIVGGISGSIITFSIIYVVLSVIINFLISNYVPLKSLKFSFRYFIKSALEPLLPTIVAYIILHYLLLTFSSQGIDIILIALSFLVFLVIYVGLYKWWFKDSYNKKIFRLKSLIT